MTTGMPIGNIASTKPAGNVKSEINENFEEALVQVRNWLKEIRFIKESTIDRNILQLKEQDTIIVKIFTFNNEYTIRIRVSESHVRPGSNLAGRCSYMGAGASGRKSRPGCIGSGGRDLPDGRFCKETWDKIISSIVGFEFQEVQSNEWKNKYIK